MQPAIPLGVPQMDADHATIEAMFEAIVAAGDDVLADRYHELEAEVIAHFAREEALMAKHGAPVAHCHKTQHNLLLGEFAAARAHADAGDFDTLRRAIVVLAELVHSHVGSVDRVTAQFLGGELDQRMVDALRLPIEAGA